MFWTDGSVYKGDWVKGIQHGFGKLILPDGTVKEGIFENNVYRGTRRGSSEKKNIKN